MSTSKKQNQVKKIQNNKQSQSVIKDSKVNIEPLNDPALETFNLPKTDVSSNRSLEVDQDSVLPSESQLANDPLEVQKIKISSEAVLEFKTLKLKEQIIQEKTSKVQISREKLDIEEENLNLRKSILNQELHRFFRTHGLTPGDKIIPDPEGGFCIHRALLEKFSVGLTSEDSE